MVQWDLKYFEEARFEHRHKPTAIAHSGDLIPGMHCKTDSVYGVSDM